MLARRLALTLRVGAIVFALSALALVAAPQSFLEFLKIERGPVGYSEELVWAMRMIGVCLLIASVMMPLVAAFAGCLRSCGSPLYSGLYLWVERKKAKPLTSTLGLESVGH